MKKIEIEYEIVRRVSQTIEVEEDDLKDLVDSGSLDILAKYGVTAESMYESCDADGWASDDFSVSDENGRTLIEWTNRS